LFKKIKRLITSQGSDRYAFSSNNNKKGKSI